MRNKKKIAIISTVPLMIFFFLRNHIKYLIRDYEVTIITNVKVNTEILNQFDNRIKIEHIPFKREIHLIFDTISLILLLKLFFRTGYDVIYSISPKAGLLSMLSGKICRIPVRINNFTGQQWIIKKGLIKKIIKFVDKSTANLATINIVDGYSQQKFLISEKIITRKNSKVILYGSICGVDLNKFKPDINNRIKIRKKLNIQLNEIVFIYLGRINKNKGIEKIAYCFENLLKKYKNMTLLLVGPDEDKITEKLRNKFINDEKLKIVPFTKNPEIYFQASDVFCTLSNKEGFGNSVIEAGSCGLPSIGSDIYGLRDSIIHDETGYLVNRDNDIEISKYFEKMLNNNNLIPELGKNAMIRSKKLFDQDKISSELIKYINNQINLM